MLQSKRFEIARLSIGILKDSQLNSTNFKKLLEMLDERTPEIYITTRKMAMTSLLEIFKDLLPSYNIHTISQEGVKCMYIKYLQENYKK